MDSEELIIGLTGDVMIGRGVDAMISKQDCLFVWGNVLPLFSATDLNLINLETTLTTSDRKVFKKFTFRASPDKIKSLIAANITVANLANNHIMDFSTVGLIQTIQTLNAAGIKHVGAGINIEEATKPEFIFKKNITTGILGFTDNEPGWKAGTSTIGINYINISENTDRYSALHSITQLRKKADIIIISIHWGPNMQPEPSKEFIAFAHEMIEAGADIIHGHSAHNFQGIEIYNHKLILYDTGDFVDNYIVNPELKNDHSFFFRVETGKHGVSKLILTPVLISNCCVNLAAKDDYEWSIQRIQYLSAKFGTTVNDKGEVMLG